MAIRERRDIDAFFQAASRSDATPWYTRYRQEMMRSLRHQEHEMFDHPVATVLVVSSSNEDPVRCFEELSSEHHLPAPFQKAFQIACYETVSIPFPRQGQYDPSIPKFYILLHDMCANPQVSPISMLFGRHSEAQTLA
jgi:hypothetical protein